MANIRASYVVSQVLLATTASVVINIAAAGGVTATAHATPVIRAAAFVVPTSVLENQIVQMSDFRALSIDRISIDVATATDDVAISFDAAFTDSVTAVDVINKMFYGNIDFDLTDPDVDPEPINIADSDAKDVGKTLTDTAEATDADAKTPGKVLTDSVTSADAINTKDIGKSLTDSAAATDVVTEFNTAKVVVDSATATDAAAKDFTRPNVTDSVTTADDSSRQPELGKTETVTASDAFGPFDIGVNPSDAVTASDAVDSFAVTTVLADSVEMTDFIAKTPGYEFDFDVVDADADPDPVTMADVMAKEFTRPETDTISATDVLNLFAVTTVLTDSVSIADSVATLLVLGQTTPIYPDYVAMSDGDTGYVGYIEWDSIISRTPDYQWIMGGDNGLLGGFYIGGEAATYDAVRFNRVFLQHRRLQRVARFGGVLNHDGSMLDHSMLVGEYTDSFNYENYTGLIGGPGLISETRLNSEFITYADTSMAGLVVNFHYTDAADRTVGGYQFNETPIL